MYFTSKKHILLLAMSMCASVMQAGNCVKPKCENTHKPTIAKAPISHNKAYFIDKHGKVVILHGMNIMQKVAPYYFPSFYESNPSGPGTIGESWVNFFAENGFNVARVGISWAGVEPSAGNYDDNYIRKIRDMVRAFGKVGVFCLLDFHQDGWCGKDGNPPGMAPNPTFGGNTFPVWAANYYLNGVPQPNNFDPFPFNTFSSPALLTVWDNFWHNVPAFTDDSQTVLDTVGVQDRFIAMHVHVAKFFKHEENLLYYSSVNEPTPDIQTWQSTGEPAFLDWVLNTDFGANAGHWPDSILYQNNFYPFMPPPNNSEFFLTLFYDFHERLNAAIHAVDHKHMIANVRTFYEVLGGKIPLVPQPTDHNIVLERNAYGTQSSPMPESALVFGLSSAIAERNNMGFFASEWGSTLEGDGTPASFPPVVRYFDEQQISWCYWAFAQGFSPEQTADSVLINTDLPAVPSNIRSDIVETFIEPYPQVIAGTPISFAYDPATKLFEFVYSTQRVIGCSRFKECRLTEIAVPPFNYPNGYKVHVTGGKVVSKKNAAKLLIKADKCAHTVTVVVEPKVAAPARNMHIQRDPKNDLTTNKDRLVAAWLAKGQPNKQ